MAPVPDVPTFYPTLKDMEAGLEAYVSRIERKAGAIGLAKIVPPKGWTPRRGGYGGKWDVPIDRPIKQHATGTRGLYRTLLVEQKPMTGNGSFKAAALAEEAALPPAEQLPSAAAQRADPALLDAVLAARERRFWRSVTLAPPTYGADVPGTLWDAPRRGAGAAVDRWNPAALDSLLSRALAATGAAIPGVSTSYLYFGMWRSLFAWHTEDCDLASVNYLHYGAPKRWYAIPPAARARFEVVMQGLLPDLFRSCPEFLRHKELMVSPALLEAHAIPVVRATQYAGEFMINFPGAYHAGFNFGYNCAESTNFATRSWIGVGARARACTCSPDSVTIRMDLFLPYAGPAARKAILDALPSDSEDESESEEEDDSDVDESECSPSRSPTPAAVASATTGSASADDGAGSDDDSAVASVPPRRKRGRPAAAKKPAKRGRPAKRAKPAPAPPAKAPPAAAAALGRARTRAGRVLTRRGRPVSAPRKLSL